MSTRFDSLPLRPELIEAVSQMGFEEMTPIQVKGLPFMLEGIDVIGQAKTGSGKTAAFGLALLNQIDPTLLSTQALVLCPTRELADQVAAELRRLAQRMSHTRILTLCGGRPYRDQLLALEHGNHVVVGTPGRIGKHIRKRSLRLSHLSVFVLDEADRMIEAAEQAGVLLMVSLNHRFLRHHQRAKALIDSGSIGEIFLCQGAFLGFSDIKGWRFDPVQTGGGVLIDSGIHRIDLLRWLVGEVVSVQAESGTYVHKQMGGEDTASMLLRFDNGCS